MGQVLGQDFSLSNTGLKKTNPGGTASEPAVEPTRVRLLKKLLAKEAVGGLCGVGG